MTASIEAQDKNTTTENINHMILLQILYVKIALFKTENDLAF